MLIEIPVKVRAHPEMGDLFGDLENEETTFEKMTLNVDCLQSVIRIPVQNECLLYTTDGYSYIVNLSYEEMVNLWRRAIDMSSESFLIKAVTDCEKEKSLRPNMN
jgi:hypothetical protein